MELDKLKKAMLCANARTLVGLADAGGNDAVTRGLQSQYQQDPNVTMPLCMSVVKHCVSVIDDGFEKQLGAQLKSALFDTNSVMEMWDETPRVYRNRFPEPGDIVIWQHFQHGKPMRTGHCGILVELPKRGHGVIVEGNIYSKYDNIKHLEQGIKINNRELKGSENMRIIGYISPWKIV